MTGRREEIRQRADEGGGAAQPETSQAGLEETSHGEETHDEWEGGFSLLQRL